VHHPLAERALRRGGPNEAFDTLLDAAGPAFSAGVRAATPASRLHGWRGLSGYLRQSFGPGWALVGDAGYYKDPCTAHGITDALRDAELLADAVVAIHAGAPEAVALASYQRIRDQLSMRLFGVAESVCRYDWSPDEIRRLLQRLYWAMIDEFEHLTSRAQAAITTRMAPRTRFASPSTPNSDHGST